MTEKVTPLVKEVYKQMGWSLKWKGTPSMAKALSLMEKRAREEEVKRVSKVAEALYDTKKLWLEEAKAEGRQEAIKEYAIFCRICKKPMYNPSRYNINARYCKDCKEKATITYGKTPIAVLKGKDIKDNKRR